MSKIISIFSIKGGVGKTTTAINLSSSLASLSRKVLLIDIDPQANSTKGLGFDTALTSKTIYDVINSGTDISQCIKKTRVKNLYLIPSKFSFMNLPLSKDDSGILKNAFNNIKNLYDYIIIDCPPSFGALTINALTGSDSVLVPVQCEYFALDAISEILGVIANVQSNYNHDITIEGFLLTMYDIKTSLCTQVSQEIRSLFKENTFLTQIPRNISLPESNRLGMPVTQFRPNSSGAQAYLSLAKEVIDKNERN